MSGSCRYSGFCAPRFAYERNGPSILMPWIYAPHSLPRYPAAFSNAFSILSYGRVIDAGQNEVTPKLARVRDMVSSVCG